MMQSTILNSYTTGDSGLSLTTACPGRPPAEQERIAAELQRLGMMMGPWVLYADFSKTSFVLNTTGST